MISPLSLLSLDRSEVMVGLFYLNPTFWAFKVRLLAHNNSALVWTLKVFFQAQLLNWFESQKTKSSLQRGERKASAATLPTQFLSQSGFLLIAND